MIRGNLHQSGRITVFPLLVAATVTLIVAQIGRLIFARQIFDWETRMVQALGINVVAYRITCGVLNLLILFWAYTRIRAKRNQAKTGQYTLPDEK